MDSGRISYAVFCLQKKRAALSAAAQSRTHSGWARPAGKSQRMRPTHRRPGRAHREEGMKVSVVLAGLVWPVLAFGQQFYTNADLAKLDVPGAYTSDDLKRLPPL